MCYTATQVSKAYDLQSFYQAKPVETLPDGYESTLYKADGFQHPELLIVFQKDDERMIDTFMWGLLPTWKRPLEDMMKLSNRTLNARSEEIRTTTSFKAAIKNQRCVVPVNSFFEYKHIFNEKGKKIDTLPFLIHPKEQPYFSLAGLYSFYKDPDTDRWYKTFSIVTEPANLFMAEIHNHAKRMPLMLSNDLIGDWLNPNTPAKMVDDIMKFACDDSSLSAFRVNRNLKKIENTEEVLLAVSEQPEVPTQGDLFTL